MRLWVQPCRRESLTGLGAVSRSRVGARFLNWAGQALKQLINRDAPKIHALGRCIRRGSDSVRIGFRKRGTAAPANQRALDASSRSSQLRSRTWIGLAVSVLVLLALGAAWSIQGKIDHDFDRALTAYRTENNQRAEVASALLTDKLEQIRQNLRTISLLPSVRELDRHGTNLSDHSLITIQQIYNNLALNVDVSEVYIVPIEFNPNGFDPFTGKREEPTLMFDELIVEAGARLEEAGVFRP